MLLKRMLWMGLLLLLLPQSLLASATATVDRTILNVGESLRLTITSDQDEKPDLSVLKADFDILQQSQSSQTTFANGKVSRRVIWVVDLMPQGEGSLIIPAIHLGQVQTKPLALRILKQGVGQGAAQQGKAMLLLAEVSTNSVYVQGQLLLTVKLLSAVNLSQVSLSELDMPQVVVQQLGQAKQYETVRQGRRFVVLEQKYALFPQQSGTLTIPALQLDARKNAGQSMFRSAGSAVRLFSDPVQIEVLPVPTGWKRQQAWLPASQVSIREIWADGQQTTFKVGEPFTRTVELVATGLTAEQLPELLQTAVLSAKATDFKQYPDKPDLQTTKQSDGVVALRREKAVFIPLQAGEFTLAGVSVFWWNTQTQTMQQVQIPDRVITVLAADGTISSQVSTAKTQVENTMQHSSNTVAHTEPLWLWQMLTLFFALGWLLTAWRWWYGCRQEQSSKKEKIGKGTKLGLDRVLKKLQRACQSHDAPRAALLLPQWGQAVFQDDSVQYMRHLHGKSAALDAALDDLERHLYGQDKQIAWSGDLLASVLQNWMVDNIKPEKKAVLKPLYD